MASVLAWADAYNTYNIQAHTYDTYNTCTCIHTYIHIHAMTWALQIHTDTYTYIHIQSVS